MACVVTANIEITVTLAYTNCKPEQKIVENEIIKMIKGKRRENECVCMGNTRKTRDNIAQLLKISLSQNYVISFHSLSKLKFYQLIM